MAYIGNQPTDNFVTFATQNFSTSATSSYTLDHAVSNENEIALFINNVRQHPGSGKAYTATGTALTLSENTASTDVMYCIFLGRAIQSTVPSTNSITAAMVSNDLISGKTALASEPADTDEFLVSDAGTLKRIDYSLIKATAGLSMVDIWRLTTDLVNTNGTISSNLEQPDTYGATTIGSAMTVSSGIFTFPATGKYMIICSAMIASGGGSGDSVLLQTQTTTDNSSYNLAAAVRTDVQDGLGDTGSSFFLFDVTDTSTHKVKFVTSGMSDGSSAIKGDTSYNATCFIFQKLGDT